MEELIRKYFRLVNEEKFDEFFELFDLEVELTGPYNFQAKGLEMVKPFYLDVPVNFPEHVDTPEEILVKGDRAAVLIDFKGKSKEGKAINIKAMDYFRIENGKIKSLNLFLDSYHMLKLRKG
jgi:ketosteroid isomerase-like protein